MAAKYPNITDATLVPFRAIEVQLENSPDLLDRPECPYPPPIKQFLKRLLTSFAASGGKQKLEFSDEDLEKEIQDLYEELRNTTITGDAKDTIALIKVRAELLTRMVALKERFLNVRNMGRFQRLVVDTLEGQLDPAQRNEFLESLDKHVR